MKTAFQTTAKICFILILGGLTACQSPRMVPSPSTPEASGPTKSKRDELGARVVTDWSRLAVQVDGATGARAREMKGFSISILGNDFSKKTAVAFYRNLAAEDRKNAQQVRGVGLSATEKRISELRDRYVGELEREARCADSVANALASETPVWAQFLRVLASMKSPDPEKGIEEIGRIAHDYIALSNLDDTAFAEFSNASTRLLDLSASADKIRKDLERAYEVRLTKLKSM